MGVRCWFTNFCQNQGPYCTKCEQVGLHYVVKTIFMDKTKIPRAYMHPSLSITASNSDLKSLEDYLENLATNVSEGRGLYLWSRNTGTGKTTVGCLILLRYLFHALKNNPYDLDYIPVMYLNVPEFLESLRRSMNDPDQEVTALMDRMVSLDTAPELLLFDDLGSERGSEWVQERLYSLLNFRTANGLASIFTSNLSREELKLKAGTPSTGPSSLRLYSRICGCTKSIELLGQDRRLN